MYLLLLITSEITDRYSTNQVWTSLQSWQSLLRYLLFLPIVLPTWGSWELVRGITSMSSVRTSENTSSVQLEISCNNRYPEKWNVRVANFSVVPVHNINPCSVRLLQPCHEAFSMAGGGWSSTQRAVTKQRAEANRGWSSSLGIGQELTALHRKKTARYEVLYSASGSDRWTRDSALGLSGACMSGHWKR
jgi:hypothetical protein